MNQTMAVAAAGLLAAACAVGEPGDAGKLRFGQVVVYAESNDFSAPIAVGVTMPIGVQGTQRPALLNDYPYLDGTLQVTGPSGAALTATRTGEGRFEAVFPAAGAYVLKAKANGAEDQLTVKAKDVAGLKLTRLILYTDDGAKRCNAAAPLTGLVLKPNQQLELSVAPRSAEGESMLGVLTLDTQESAVTLSRPIGMANTFRIAPPANATGRASVLFKLSGTSHEVGLTLDHDATPASCP